MRTKILMCTILIISFVSQAFALNTYYVPVFKSKPQYWSGLGITNLARYSSADVSVTIYSQNGDILMAETKNIVAAGQDTFLAGKDLTSDGWIAVSSDQPLTGINFLGKYDEALANFYLSDVPFMKTLSNSLIIPHVAQNANWDTTLFIANPSISAAIVAVTYTNKSGSASTPYEISIPPNGGKEISLVSITGSNSIKGGYVIISSSTELAAFAIFSNLKTSNYGYTGIAAETFSYNSDTDFEITDWTTKTHGKSADPDFAEVFDDAAVKRLDLVITEDRWQSMLDDMTGLYGEFGSSNADFPGEGVTDVDDPIFVPAEIFYSGKEWYRVGVRFKGNSSLQSSWERGILKLPFKLDFDEFEDDYPQIENQRFYGFKKFSLKNNYDDKSFMRERVAAKVFENAGLAVSHTAFYALYVDHGNGPEYFGLYTLVEEVDNTVIKTQFSDNDGNLYKPEDSGASFVDGTFAETNFEKKTNEDKEDWSDIITLFAALHDGNRTVDPFSWRANLDTIFNTDVFLKYLAVNTVIQNWDTYGRMTQNYYLYNDPDNSKLTWIPWDMNEALQEGKMGGALALDFSNIQTGGWPLIEYLYADDVYKAKYDAYVEDTINIFFEENDIRAIYATYSVLIEPYATSEIQGYSFLNNTAEFQQAMSELYQQLESRVSAVADYLD